jgi:hypothetical protein
MGQRSLGHESCEQGPVEDVAGAERAHDIHLTGRLLDDSAVLCVGEAARGATRDDDELGAGLERSLRAAEARAESGLGRCVDRDALQVESVDRVAAVD